MTTTDNELMTQLPGETPTTDWKALCVELFKACETLYNQSVTASHHQTITLSNGEHPIPISSDILAQDAVFGDLLRRTRAALAKQQGEGPSESDVAELFFRYMGAGPEAGFENAIAEALSRWGHQPARLRNCPTHGQQPPEAWGCPECVRELREELHRTVPVQPTPPAEWEVAELVVWLRENAEDERQMCESSNRASLNLERAAELLQQQHPTPVPMSERLPGDQLCWWYEPDEPDGYGGRWNLLRIRGGTGTFSHWLPAHALPLPQGEVEG